MMSKIIFTLAVTLALSGCSSYSSSFSCPDAKGLNCLPMRLVDQKIDNGEVKELEQFNCRGKKCKLPQQLPPLMLEEVNRIQIEEDIDKKSRGILNDG